MSSAEKTIKKANNTEKTDTATLTSISEVGLRR